MSSRQTPLPTILAGPILRHVSESTFSLWFASSKALDEARNSLVPVIMDSEQQRLEIASDNIKHEQIRVGEKCFIHLLHVTQAGLLSANNLYNYDVNIGQESFSSILSKHLYSDQQRFSFYLARELTNVIHGSCRKAHHCARDALPQLDVLINKCIEDHKPPSQRPDLVLFTGDQVYIDDVAAPMLVAIGQVIKLLGLYHEEFEGSTISHSEQLLDTPAHLYNRDTLLPTSDDNKDLDKAFFRAKNKPVFTSVNASNHLIALNEMIALYLLSWSSKLWQYCDISVPDLDEKALQRYAQEVSAIEQFVETLPQVERAMAHVPIYMIFDDHDVTDDWNLTRNWEEQIYGHPFSRRIVGNALCSYYLFQGLGNPSSTWQPLVAKAKQISNSDGQFCHRDFIQQLFEFTQWHYALDTHPPVHVLDTRTQRWRSESNGNKPSGLMDWEALCELQQKIIGKDSVIMVSAAPVYGVKFIEMIQRVFTSFGGALMVDAENWMAHKGTASVMLNIFKHIKTPPNFIILSGDVHYSFVYDVSLRFRRNSPHITQFTCSGIHNQFPNTLISWFERLNSFLYSHRSPLNWLTKRRNMSIIERKAAFPSGYQHPLLGEHKEIVNGSALGQLLLDKNGNEKSCQLILADGTVVSFEAEKSKKTH